ncbi:MAG: DUF1990 domain-containing protein [Deltaproteobacteria bacterium]|nr:DUF1990 domain-containing protein [Deltaproteobacteria bacterium]MDQ3298805.1 DUF1990 domain-containing protein [Myxococcota bacterium]
MWSVTRPSAEAVRRFLDRERGLACSYPEVGATAGDRRDGPPTMPAGYSHDHNRQLLGHGSETFAVASTALRAWRQFPAGWTAIEPADTPIARDQVVGVLVHAVGLWWLNSARIVYVIDEPRRFGFAYGTLPGHAECGEERFTVERLADDAVWYDVRAFSKPRHWAARLGAPVTRALQRRFARDSKAAMAAAVTATSGMRVKPQ